MEKIRLIITKCMQQAFYVVGIFCMESDSESGAGVSQRTTLNDRDFTPFEQFMAL